jgi:hypothetical protein
VSGVHTDGAGAALKIPVCAMTADAVTTAATDPTTSASFLFIA